MAREINCPFCDFKSRQEPRFYKHLETLHDVSDMETCYFERVLNLKSPPTCECSSECNEPLKWWGWMKGYPSKYVRGHNARVYTVFSDPLVAKANAKKRIESNKQGKWNAWNKGLTKETDERVAQSAQNISRTNQRKMAEGDDLNWRKKYPKKAKLVAKKQSETLRKTYKNGYSNWNAGKTKETDKRLAISAKKISESYKRREIGRRLSVKEVIARIAKFPDFEFIGSHDDYRRYDNQRLPFKCLICDEIQMKSLAMLENSPICFNCHPTESVCQLEVYDFVKELDETTNLSDREIISPKEIDVLVPNKLAIEYDGLWYHSERIKKDKDYAKKKMKMCRALDIPYFVVYSDEWREKRPIVESMIRHRLGKSSIRLGARKCELIDVESRERKVFFDANHLEGDTSAKHAIGLKYDGELVAVMSFRTPKIKKYREDEYIELARFAVRLDTSVSGATSRLVRAAKHWADKQGYKGLMTYVDMRVGDGKGYLNAGFKNIGETVNRFWWTDFINRFDRFRFRADKSRGMTEKQVAEEAGVFKIFGCPNLIFTMDI